LLIYSEVAQISHCYTDLWTRKSVANTGWNLIDLEIDDADELYNTVVILRGKFGRSQFPSYL